MGSLFYPQVAPTGPFESVVVIISVVLVIVLPGWL